MVECPICYDEIIFPSCIKPCEHMFCNRCITKWLKKKMHCPLCRCKCKMDISKESSKEYGYFSYDRKLYLLTRFMGI